MFWMHVLVQCFGGQWAIALPMEKGERTPMASLVERYELLHAQKTGCNV